MTPPPRTITVDLPAHNVWADVATPQPTMVGDHECLADASDTTGFSMSATTSGLKVGTTTEGGGNTAVGFGLLDLPIGATLVDARFVARMDVSSVGDVPAGSYDTGGWNYPTPVRYPTLAVDYEWGATRQLYTLDAPDTGTGQVEVVGGSSIAHLLDGNDYLIAGIGTPDTGTFGLCPRVYIADPWWQSPPENNPVFVSYLAIRVTYTLSPCFQELTATFKPDAPATFTSTANAADDVVWRDGDPATYVTMTGPAGECYGLLDSYAGPAALDLTVGITAASASGDSFVLALKAGTAPWAVGDYIIETPMTVLAGTTQTEYSHSYSEAELADAGLTFDAVIAGLANETALIGIAGVADLVVSEAWVRVGHKCYVLNPLRIHPRSSTRIYPRRRTRRPGTF